MKGDTGNGIASIALTSTSGAVKTYTITFTDGTTFDYQVTDGEVTMSEFLKAFVVDTETGNPCTFPDGADEIPMKSLMAEIDPVQDGTPWMADTLETEPYVFRKSPNMNHSSDCETSFKFSTYP